MNAEPDTDPLARPSSDQHTDVCAKSNSTRVDWLAKDLYRYFASSARKEFLNHYDAAAVSGDMHRTRIVGGGEACRSSRRKVFSVVVSIRADCRYNWDELMSALALEARESSGAEISGIYRNGDMVMGRNVNLTLDVVRGHGTAGIRPIEGSAGYVNRGALQ